MGGGCKRLTPGPWPNWLGHTTTLLRPLEAVQPAVCVCVCARARARAGVRACVHAYLSHAHAKVRETESPRERECPRLGGGGRRERGEGGVGGEA